MRLRASVTIQRRITTVFEFLTTAGSFPAWVAEVIGADGPAAEGMGIGAQLVVHTQGLVGEVSSTWEVTAYEPPRRLAVRQLLDGGPCVEARWTLAGAAPAGTEVWVVADIEAASFFRPAAARLQAVGSQQLQDDLERLRRVLEDTESRDSAAAARV